MASDIQRLRELLKRAELEESSNASEADTEASYLDDLDDESVQSAAPTPQRRRAPVQKRIVAGARAESYSVAPPKEKIKKPMTDWNKEFARVTKEAAAKYRETHPKKERVLKPSSEANEWVQFMRAHAKDQEVAATPGKDRRYKLSCMYRASKGMPPKQRRLTVKQEQKE